MSKPLTHNEMISAIFAANTEAFRLEEELEKVAKERDEAIRERDEARREACERTAENLSLLGSNVRLSTLRVEHAARRGWDCYAEPRWKSDPNIISPEELARCTRNDHND